MKKILNIVSSVKGEASLSIQLSNEILKKLTTLYPGSEVHTHDLAEKPFPHLEDKHVTAFYTPAEARTAEQNEAVKPSDEAIKELMEADIIVIGVPYYNFGIPSTLKAWIDHIVRVGITFKYADGAPAGFVTNKKVYLAMASGAVFSEGAMNKYDFAEPFLRTVLGFIGMTDMTVFRVEGTMIPGIMETALPGALSTVNEFAF